MRRAKGGFSKEADGEEETPELVPISVPEKEPELVPA